jgi:hypothetical protein
MLALMAEELVGVGRATDVAGAACGEGDGALVGEEVGTISLFPLEAIFAWLVVFA